MTRDRPVRDTADWRALAARVFELEGECSDARDQSRLLTALHESFGRITATRMPDDVIAHMLRAAFDPLGFSRAVYFGVTRERGFEGRFALDGSDVVEPNAEIPHAGVGSAIVLALRGDARESVGLAGDLSAPVVDVRGWYVMSALQSADGPVGVLYVDGHSSRRPRDWEAGLVRSLATIGAISMENSVLFAKTRELAIRDPLTGLYNRRAFSERLLSEIDATRMHCRPFAYVMIDIDDFKRVNDVHGHAHGDAVLRLLAETLTRGCRAQDVVGRYAGDEFVVLLVNVSRDQALKRVARLSRDLQEVDLRCSLGVASFPSDAGDAVSLLVAADRALYATKAAGKNGFTFASGNE